MTTDESGVLVVDKPAGWTSHQVVGRCRRLLGTRKVGHAGTLDPMATGVLVVGFGRATRLLGLLSLHDKRYLATIRIGVTTVTEDADGEITSVPGAAGIGIDDVRAASAAFLGDIEQVPSSVSAIKVGGVRSYARVRAGEDVSLAARPVTISRFDVLAARADEVDGTPVLDVDVDVECTTGTYVRALARDVGQALGSGAHLTSLRRTRVGGYSLADVTLDLAGLEAGLRPGSMTMADAARRSFPVLDLDARQAREVTFGRPLDVAIDKLTAMIGPDGRLLGLYRRQAGQAVPQTVLTAPDQGAGEV